jgi:hypothetical protein
LPIFDSIGGELKYSSLIKIAFKQSTIEKLINNINEDAFPVNIIREAAKGSLEMREFLDELDRRREKFKIKKDVIIAEIYESVDFFN